jgi:hypothetical protein
MKVGGSDMEGNVSLDRKGTSIHSQTPVTEALDYKDWPVFRSPAQGRCKASAADQELEAAKRADEKTPAKPYDLNRCGSGCRRRGERVVA